MTREPQPPAVERGAEGDLTVVVLVTFDRASRHASLIRSDGKEARLPIGDSMFEPTSKLQRVHLAPAAKAMLFETVEGHNIATQLSDPDAPAPIGGRPVVYLDHNHWNTLYKAGHQPHRVPDPDELAAAHWLIDEVRRGEVILPKAAQHVQETCQWPNDEERYLLALTILQLSGGWHLRDPLHIRLEELRYSMTSHYRRGRRSRQRRSRWKPSCTQPAPSRTPLRSTSHATPPTSSASSSRSPQTSTRCSTPR